MTAMKFGGPDERAKAARAAVNRLRWEVDVALGVAAGQQTPGPYPPYQALAVLHEITETLAIRRQIVITIDAHVPADDPRREQFAARLEFYRSYHEVAR